MTCLLCALKEENDNHVVFECDSVERKLRVALSSKPEDNTDIVVGILLLAKGTIKEGFTIQNNLIPPKRTKTIIGSELCSSSFSHEILFPRNFTLKIRVCKSPCYYSTA